MNEEYTNSLGRFFLYFLAMTLAIFIFIGNIIVSAVLNYLAENLNYLNSENFAYYAILICASINTFYIMITGFIYEKICVKLTTWENHKTASDYELSFTIKALIFRTINRLVPLVMIAFVNDYFSWSCGVNWYCWDYLLIYYRSMLYVFFTAQCLQYLNSAFIFLAKKAAYTLLKFAKSDKSNPYHKINKYIKKESIKLEFSPSEELDGTLSEFINMTVNFSMVSLFAVCFPVCFPMSAFLFFLSMHFNKLKLTKLCKRPKPVGAAAVGACKAVFHLVGYLSVLSNAGLLCNTMNLFGGSAALSYFVIIVMWIFLLKFLVQKLVVKVPDKTGLILLRSQMVADKTIKNKGNIAGTYRMSQKQPIYKVYGTLLQSRPKKIIEEEKENQDKKSNKDIANTKSNKDNSIPKNNNEIVNDPKSNKENGDNKDIKNKDIEMSKVGQKKKEEKKA